MTALFGSLSTLALFGLTFTSIFTSGLSAATGMGGGVLLFAVMTIFFPMNVLIPIHGVIQFFNNLFIVIFLKQHLKRSLLQPFLIGSVFGITLGAFLVSRIVKTHIPQFIILTLIAYTLFRPKRLPDLKLKHKNFVFVGFITGFLGMIAGAVDPVLGPFFIRDDLSKEEVIANKAFMQSIVHFSKIPIFYFLGFDFIPYIGLCLLLNFACIFGTKFGIVVLERMSDKVFILVFKIALVGSGLKILYSVF